MTKYFNYNISISSSTSKGVSQTKENQSIEKITHTTKNNYVSKYNDAPFFKSGVSAAELTNLSLEQREKYYGFYYILDNGEQPPDFYKANQGSWGNKNQKKIDFGKDAFSLGSNIKAEDTIPTYNLKDNTIKNFTLPNGQNLLSFLKKNNVRTGDNVEIKITQKGVELIKKKK